MIKTTTRLVGIIFFSIFLLLAGCGERENSKRIKAPALSAVTVTVAEAKLETADSLINVVGTVEALQRASISARISGQIIELPVVLGSEVKKGNLLVKINAGEISARALRAEAELARARRNLERENRLQQEEASTLETVKSLRDAVRIAEAAYQEAQTMLDYTTVSAPFSGVITSKMVNIGDLAFPGMELLRLENNKKLQVVAQIPEALLLSIAAGDKLPVNIPANGLSLSGEIAEISPAADPTTRAASIKITIPPHPSLRAGQFARVSLADSSTTTLMIAESAVITRGQMKIVFVVENNRARLRLVRTGAVRDSRIEIIAGLDPGELVVTGGTAELEDGRPLIIEHNE
jgi:RND family efflux transporter MFP subunit